MGCNGLRTAWRSPMYRGLNTDYPSASLSGGAPTPAPTAPLGELSFRTADRLTFLEGRIAHLGVRLRGLPFGGPPKNADAVSVQPNLMDSLASSHLTMDRIEAMIV